MIPDYYGNLIICVARRIFEINVQDGLVVPIAGTTTVGFILDSYELTY